MVAWAMFTALIVCKDKGELYWKMDVAEQQPLFYLKAVHVAVLCRKCSPERQQLLLWLCHLNEKELKVSLSPLIGSVHVASTEAFWCVRIACYTYISI